VRPTLRVGRHASNLGGATDYLAGVRRVIRCWDQLIRQEPHVLEDGVLGGPPPSRSRKMTWARVFVVYPCASSCSQGAAQPAASDMSGISPTTLSSRWSRQGRPPSCADDRTRRDNSSGPVGERHDDIGGPPGGREGGSQQGTTIGGRDAGGGWPTMGPETDNTRRDAVDVLAMTSHPVDRRRDGPLCFRVARICRARPAPPDGAYPLGPTAPPSNRADTVRMGRRGRSALMWGPCGGWVPLVAGRPGLWGTWPADRR